MKSVELSENIKYSLDRASFEVQRSISSLVFMMNRNLDNPDFFNSSVYKRLSDRILETYIYYWEVTNEMLNRLNIQTRNWRTSDENYVLYYE